MAHERDKLIALATDRRDRMPSNGRPRFDLTDEEIERPREDRVVVMSEEVEAIELG